jgi:hypothetical protein
MENVRVIAKIGNPPPAEVVSTWRLTFRKNYRAPATAAQATEAPEQESAAARAAAGADGALSEEPGGRDGGGAGALSAVVLGRMSNKFASEVLKAHWRGDDAAGHCFAQHHRHRNSRASEALPDNCY